MTQVHANLRQVPAGQVPRQLNDILRQLQNAFRELKGTSGEIDLLSSVSVEQTGLGSGLKIFSTGVGAALGASIDDSAVHLARGGYRDSTGTWIATDAVAVILSLTREGSLKLYRNTGLSQNGPFNPILVGEILPPGLSPSTSVITVTSSYTVVQGITVVLVDASTGDVTITLPSVGGSSGRNLYVKKIDASANLVILTGDADIDGDLTMELMAEDESVRVVCDGTEWWII